MMQHWLVYAGAVAVTSLLSLANVGLKVLSSQIPAILVGLRGGDLLPLFASVPTIIGVGGSYCLGAALWLWVLNQMPLNKAYLFVCLTFVMVPLLSHFVLGEKIGLGVYVGTPIIVLGIIVSTTLG